MNKVGFVVGHPTQFEAPFFRYITNSGGMESISVYYYNFKEEIIRDRELRDLNSRNWGIDIVSGYSWKTISTNYFSNAIKILKENEYIIVNGYTSTLTLFIILLSKFYKTKVGLRLDTVPWNNRGFIKRVLKASFLNVLSFFIDIFWVTGTKTKEYLRSCGINESRMKICSYIVDIEWFRNGSNISEEEQKKIKVKYKIRLDNRVILAIVKLVRRESPEDVIRAFGKTGLYNVSLVIVGDGELKAELESHAAEWVNGKEVIFTGYIPYLDLPEIYSIADVYIHSAENEPWGVSVQEAMSCELPVIASNYVGSGFDLIEEQANGMIYKYGDISALSACIEEVLSLDTTIVKEKNQEILDKWNYQITWKEIYDHVNKLGNHKVEANH